LYIYRKGQILHKVYFNLAAIGWIHISYTK